MKKLLLLPFLLSALFSSGQIITATTNDCEFKFTLPNQVYGAGIAANLKTTRYVSFDQIHYKRIMVDNTAGAEKFQVFLTLGVETFGFSENIASTYYGVTATALFNQIVAVIDASACGSGGGGPGAGTVTDFIYTDGNGLDGTVTNSTTTPTLVIQPTATQYSVFFADPANSFAQDNTGINYNNSTNRLGLGIAPASTTAQFHVKGGSLLLANTGIRYTDSGDKNLFSIADNGFMQFGRTTSSTSSDQGNIIIMSVMSAANTLTTGKYNVALLANPNTTQVNFTTGERNFVAVDAGASITTGNNNVAIGSTSLRDNLVGVSNIALSNDVLTLCTGSDNIGLGQFSLFNSANVNRNIGIGSNAGAQNSIGSTNTYLGYFAGIGPQAEAATTNTSRSVYLGPETMATQSNECVIGGHQVNKFYWECGKWAYDDILNPHELTVSAGSMPVIAGSNITSQLSMWYQASSGSGTGGSAPIGFRTAYPGASGTANNTYTSAFTVFGGNTSNNFIGASLTPIINQGTTFSYTGVEIDVATTSEGSGTHRLLNIQEDNTDIFTVHDNKTVLTASRFETVQGADVASVAGAIAVGNDGNSFELTGTNAVTLISNVGWQNGSEITFIFTSTATLTDGTANSGTDIGMELLGNANFVGSADDVVTLLLSELGGTQRWRMVSSSVN